jgi:hypothetical protein
MPEIIFSYSSHQGTWLRAFALSISSTLISVAAIAICGEVNKSQYRGYIYYLRLQRSRCAVPAMEPKTCSPRGEWGWVMN